MSSPARPITSGPQCVKLTVLAQKDHPSEEAHEAHEHHEYSGWGAWGILGFIILVVIIWLILIMVKPRFILNCGEKKEEEEDENCERKKHSRHNKFEINNGKALLWAIVIAFILAIIIYIICVFVFGWGSRSRKC